MARRRSRSGDSIRAAKAVGSIPGLTTETLDAVKRPHSMPCRRSACDTATQWVVIRPTIRSSAINAFCCQNGCAGVTPYPCIVCRMQGTPASQAANRPRIPAFELWVCTIFGLRRRNVPTSSHRARTSWRGRISRRSDGIVRTSTPSSACASSVSSPPGPARSTGRNRLRSRPDTTCIATSCAPPNSSFVMT
jgi:hypothetical protein